MNKLHIHLLLIVTSILLPTTLVTATNPPPQPNPGPGGGFVNITWTNPIQDSSGTPINSVSQVVMIILQALIVIATPIVVVMIIYAGFLYVTARGNAEQVKKATTALTYAIIGGILVIGAVAITGIIGQTVASFQ